MTIKDTLTKRELLILEFANTPMAKNGHYDGGNIQQYVEDAAAFADAIDDLNLDNFVMMLHGRKLYKDSTLLVKDHYDRFINPVNASDFYSDAVHEPIWKILLRTEKMQKFYKVK